MSDTYQMLSPASAQGTCSESDVLCSAVCWISVSESVSVSTAGTQNWN